MAIKSTDHLTTRDIYELIAASDRRTAEGFTRVEEKIDKIADDRVAPVEQKLANIEGRIMMISVLIPIGISMFFMIINYILNKI